MRDSRSTSLGGGREEEVDCIRRTIALNLSSGIHRYASIQTDTHVNTYTHKAEVFIIGYRIKIKYSSYDTSIFNDI